jgi:hypothetical protein
MVLSIQTVVAVGTQPVAASFQLADFAENGKLKTCRHE